MEFEWIPLLPGVTLAISTEHRFTTDSVLLARFASPAAREQVVELGAGCGAITLLWFGEREISPAEVVCVEQDADAIELLRKSVEQNGLSGRVFPLCSDLRSLNRAPPLQGHFDLVVCNPPYFVPTPDREPSSPVRRAARQEFTATIGEVSAAAAKLLRFGGRFCCCWRPERLPDLFEALRQHALEPKRIRAVCNTADSAPSLFLVEAVQGGGRELRWLPPLVMTGQNGAPSEEYRLIYRMNGG